MNPKAKGIFIFAALLLFLIPGICAVFSGVKRASDRARNLEESFRNVDFAAEYPFEGADAAPVAAVESTLPERYRAAAGRLTGFIDDCCGKYNVISPFYFYLYGKTADTLGKAYTDDAETPVIRLENGYLTYAYRYEQGTEDLSWIPELSAWLKERGIFFLPVIPADKSDGRYAVYPKGYPFGYAGQENGYLKFLDDSGIPYLDPEKTLLSQNGDFYYWFYRSDHHWNVHAGFSVASVAAEKLKTESGLPVDTGVLDRTRFDMVTYENALLGSQGKKTTHGYIPPEDFEVYYPLFDTAFSVEIPTRMIDRTGAFEDTLIKSEALTAGDYYMNSTYTAFLYGDVPLVRIHNLNCDNGTRVLMLKTSEADVVDTYLAFTVEYLDIIDPRHFGGSIKTFIERTCPDAVLMCAYPSAITENGTRDIK